MEVYRQNSNLNSLWQIGYRIENSEDTIIMYYDVPTHADGSYVDMTHGKYYNDLVLEAKKNIAYKLWAGYGEISKKTLFKMIDIQWHEWME